MKADLIRCFRNPLYWLVLSAGLSVRAILAYFDFQTRRLPLQRTPSSRRMPTP